MSCTRRCAPAGAPGSESGRRAAGRWPFKRCLGSPRLPAPLRAGPAPYPVRLASLGSSRYGVRLGAVPSAPPVRAGAGEQPPGRLEGARGAAAALPAAGRGLGRGGELARPRHACEPVPACPGSGPRSGPPSRGRRAPGAGRAPRALGLVGQERLAGSGWAWARRPRQPIASPGAHSVSLRPRGQVQACWGLALSLPPCLAPWPCESWWSRSAGAPTP